MEQVIRNAPWRWSRPGRMPRRSTTWLIAGIALLLSFPAQAADAPTEYQVQAAFLLNFTRFIEWPAAAFQAAGSPFDICILGDDPFGSALDQTVAGEIANGRSVAARRLLRAPEPKTCQVLFIGTSEKNIGKILSGLGPGVLTVGEGESFVRGGGMIAFVVENRRVRFEINQAAAESAGLKLSSRLLSVAKAVEK
jgi:hypothetical protein